jgi:hypothetical protein
MSGPTATAVPRRHPTQVPNPGQAVLHTVYILYVHIQVAADQPSAGHTEVTYRDLPCKDCFHATAEQQRTPGTRMTRPRMDAAASAHPLVMTAPTVNTAPTINREEPLQAGCPHGWLPAEVTNGAPISTAGSTRSSACSGSAG